MPLLLKTCILFHIWISLFPLDPWPTPTLVPAGGDLQSCGYGDAAGDAHFDAFSWMTKRRRIILEQTFGVFCFLFGVLCNVWMNLCFSVLNSLVLGIVFSKNTCYDIFGYCAIYCIVFCMVDGGMNGWW